SRCANPADNPQVQGILAFCRADTRGPASVRRGLGPPQDTRVVQRSRQHCRGGSARGPRRFAWVLVVLLAAAGALAPSASADRAFAPRFSATDRGQVVTAGNTVLSCQGTGTGCKNAQAGTTTADNNDFDMDYVDVDSDSSTFNSSRATLALPSGSTVLFAGL